VALTAAGAALVPEARDLLLRVHDLTRVARTSADGQAGRLRLAFVSTVGFALLPQWVRVFRERYPNVVTELIEAIGDVQLDLLKRSEIDAGFMLHSPGFAPPDLQRLLVASEPLVLALPEHHHDAVFALYHASGFLPQEAQEAIQMQTIVNLVSAGMGPAWLPQSVLP
jgi:DNA-binding transcriptional LysR family regulator